MNQDIPIRCMGVGGRRAKARQPGSIAGRLKRVAKRLFVLLNRRLVHRHFSIPYQLFQYYLARRLQSRAMVGYCKCANYAIYIYIWIWIAILCFNVYCEIDIFPWSTLGIADVHISHCGSGERDRGEEFEQPF